MNKLNADLREIVDNHVHANDNLRVGHPLRDKGHKISMALQNMFKHWHDHFKTSIWSVDSVENTSGIAADHQMMQTT